MPNLVRPSYLALRNDDLVSKLSAGLGFAQPPRITLKDDRFTILTAQGERDPRAQASLTIDVIVVGGNDGPSKIYYAGAYDPNNAEGPTCFSDNGVAPSENAQQPQSPTCAACPQAVWGSKISAMGSKIQACATYKKIAVIVPSIGSPDVFLLAIPPASLKPWRNYLAHLGNLGASPDEVVTRVSMEEKTLGFEPVDFIKESWVAGIRKIVESPEPNLVTGNNDKPIQALSAPQKEASAFPPPAQPAAENQARTRTESSPPPSDTFLPGDRLSGSATTASPSDEGERQPATMEELRARLAELEAEAAQKSKRGRPAAKKTEVVNGRTETTIGAGTIPQGSFLDGGRSGDVPPADQAIEDMLNRSFGTAK